ncbi:MAG: hypothetical protein E4H27_10440 [Anaerolineales bacterium]|nr:MAG: hypothetical protein E4H27_10440 [Anaerolineales bacterium]
MFEKSSVTTFSPRLKTGLGWGVDGLGSTLGVAVCVGVAGNQSIVGLGSNVGIAVSVGSGNSVTAALVQPDRKTNRQMPASQNDFGKIIKIGFPLLNMLFIINPYSSL